MICSSLLAKQYFPRQRRLAFTDWETRSRLCFFSDWWEGVWGKSNLPQKSSTVPSEPKFGPPSAPMKNSWISPCKDVTLSSEPISPKVILFHKCFSARRGRISSLLPKCAGQNYVTWHALHDCTESWFACGSSTVVFVHCPGGKWNCYSYKFKFFIHFLLEVFPGNLLRSSMDS